MFGYGRGWYRGWHRLPYEDLPGGYTYIGPCRCGYGPHAYYKDRDGRVLHVSELYRAVPAKPTKEELAEELEWPKEEKAQLEKRVSDLEGSLKGGQK